MINIQLTVQLNAYWSAQKKKMVDLDYLSKHTKELSTIDQ